MRASVVIGANYGDEGKGLLVDWLAASDPRNTVVVRFNGGAQAGHTVVTPDGVRHVFHHFGSGTLAGAATYLSQHVLVNPIQYAMEYHDLRAKLRTPASVRWPTVYIHPAAPVTTPWDMMLNQAAERARGADRHGSCGMGINETAQRHTHLRWRLTVGDLIGARADAILGRIRMEYVPQRSRELGVELDSIWHTEALLRRYEEDVRLLLDTTTISREWRPYNHVVFEGAQGLRLDELAAGFPYLTRSRTGLTNVLDMTAEPDSLDVYYVTRPYITRHGAGPLSHECAQPEGVVDETNLPNEWQGELRFGEFDLQEFTQFVLGDLAQRGYHYIRHHLAVTCLDQGDRVPIHLNGRRHVVPPAAFVSRVAKAIRAQSIVTSRGPTRQTITGRVGEGVAA
jgi:adenylosuccinate synthase